MVSMEKMDIHDMTVRRWGTKVDLALLEIILGPVAKEDMIAFLHVKRVDCLLRPCLRATRRCTFSDAVLFFDVVERGA